MDKIAKWIIAVLVVNLFLTLGIGIAVLRSGGNIGAIGSKLIEDYVPVIKYNEGLYTALPIYTTGTLKADGTFTLGSGTAITRVLHGTCTLTSYASLAATSTTWHDCAVTGATTADRVVFGAPYTIQATSNLMYVNPRASSTAGYIGVEIYNNTGAATTSYPLATTSVPYWIFK